MWEDEHLVVVDKPAGIAVHPAGSTRTGTLVHGLLALGAEGGEDDDRPGIVHRLDRDTSGLLVVARSAAAHERLQELIRSRELERTYAALVRGRPRSRTGRIEAPIGRDRRDRTRHSLDTATPRDAVTWFEVRELMRHHALLDVRLETGRTHQIRVHLEAIDLPVSGDPVYGVPHDLGLERQFLHARRLRFAHPFTGAEVDVELGAAGRSRSRAGAGASLKTRTPGEAGQRASGTISPLTFLYPAISARAVVPRLRDRSPVPSRPAGARQPKTTSKGAGPVGSRLHEGASGGWSSLRPPDPPLEPEDEALHLHRARRHLHHRPAADAAARRGSARLRAQHRRARRHDPLRRHEEAGSGCGSHRGRARRHAVRVEPLAGRPAHQLAHDLRPDRVPPRPPPPEDGRPARAAARKGADHDGGRAREARGEPRRRRRHAPPAGRDLHHRPEEGGPRRPGGAAPASASDRARRHELRSRRGRLRDPGQRRRDPLVLARSCARSPTASPRARARSPRRSSPPPRRPPTPRQRRGEAPRLPPSPRLPLPPRLRPRPSRSRRRRAAPEAAQPEAAADARACRRAEAEEPVAVAAEEDGEASA